jgi:Secretion system C-terminal sorting domain
MLKKLFVILLFISGLTVSEAQNQGDVAWNKTFGGEDYDEANSVVLTNSGDVIAAGYTQSYGLGRWGNAFIFKADSNGDSVWTRNFGWDGIDVFADLVKSSDGMFVATGLTDTPNDFENIYLVKVDEDGNLQWEKNFGGPQKDVAQSLTNSTDGGLIITGVTKSFSVGEEDLFILKTTVNGDSLWFKTYGTTGNDGGYGISKTSDGGYIITGQYNWSDMWLLKVDENGDTLWTKTFGGINYDEGISVIETDDHGFIISGSTSSYGAGDLDVYVVKTDSSGNFEWQKTYGGSGYDEGRRIIKRDNGYLVMGSTDSGVAGEFDYFIIWTDENGDTVQTKTYGDTGEDRCYDVISVGNDYFLIAGSDFNNTTLNDASLLLIYSGNNPSNVNPEFTPSGYNLADAYPNPFNPSTKINYSIPGSGFVSLKVFNVLGKEVATLVNEEKPAGSYQVDFNASGLASGIYLYKLQTRNFVETKKMILMK